jgi:hypothetical protein
MRFVERRESGGGEMPERKSRIRTIVLALAFVALSLVRAEAGSPLDRAAAMGRVAGTFEALSRKVPPTILRKLSGGVRNYIHLAQRWKELGPAWSSARAQGLESPTALPAGVSSFTPIAVSLPAKDLSSRFAGFVQSETSSAWCGSNVVVGYNDTASFFQVFPGESASFVGYAVSTNSGTSFRGGKTLPPVSLPAGVLLRSLIGDPVVACTSKTNFFFSSMMLDTLNDGGQVMGVSVSSSTDGGFTFGGDVMAVGKVFGEQDHILDKDWFTVDPTNAMRLYVTYTDIDFTGALCPSDTRVAIEIVSSADGGATWSSPTVVKETCAGSAGAVQGSQVIVGSGGEVYVAYESFDAFGNPQMIEIASSTDRGQSFTPPVVVSPVTPVGGVNILGNGDQTLQGGFRTNEFPSLAIDRSPKPSNGNVYIAWNDGGSFVGDLVSATTAYVYADILVSRSQDGVTWSPPVRVNNNPEPLIFGTPGSSTDQYEPGLAVDQTSGKLGVCFYDRRRDPKNFRIDRECAKSTNQGATWTNTRVTATSFAPEIGQDAFLEPDYMGDYDTVASEFLGTKAGFFGAWGDNTKGNPDVLGSRF